MPYNIVEQAVEDYKAELGKGKTFIGVSVDIYDKVYRLDVDLYREYAHIGVISPNGNTLTVHRFVLKDDIPQNVADIVLKMVLAKVTAPRRFLSHYLMTDNCQEVMLFPPDHVISFNSSITYLKTLEVGVGDYVFYDTEYKKREYHLKWMYLREWDNMLYERFGIDMWELYDFPYTANAIDNVVKLNIIGQDVNLQFQTTIGIVKV